MIAKMERDRSSFHREEKVEKRKKKKEETIHCLYIRLYILARANTRICMYSIKDIVLS